jgi:N utilization substance protein B
MSKARSRARQLAVQALYQWQIAGTNIAAIERQFLEEQGKKRLDVEYFADLLHGVPASLDKLDACLTEVTSRAIEEIDPVERAVLRIGAYEFLQHPEVPYRVVINEGVELSKLFGAEQSHRFVNGVLDKLAGKLRATEVAQDSRHRVPGQ